MKKLLIFLMVALPIAIILVVNFTISVVIGDAFISVDRIILSETSVTANVDDTLHIDCTIYPENATNKQVIWTSDNEDVATVDINGNVKFVGFGEGHIIATSQDGNKRASMYYYVTDSKVHDVIITSPKSEIAIGENVQLIANIFPNEALDKSVTFYSDREDIIKVSLNGLAYGLKEGYATITAVTKDGGYEDSINLHVYNPVTSIDLDEENVTTSKSYYHINYTVYPLDATYSSEVQFTLDNPDIATVDSFGIVTFNKAGTVTVTATTEDGGFTDQVVITFTDGYAVDLIIENISLNLKVDDVYKINYQTIPQEIYNTQVEFTSQNSDVARVDSTGFIYAMGGGVTVVEVFVDKTPTQTITKQIYVYVEKPAEDISIESNIFTAEKSILLSPISLPSDSTNTTFFFHSHNSDVATVSNDGVVKFNVDYSTNVQIDIYANEDFSQVVKVITVTYTAGRAIDYQLINDNFTVNYNEIIEFDINFIPSNTVLKDYKITILDEENHKNILEILENGTVRAIGGGNCVVEIKYQTFDGEFLIKYCDITVIRESEDINIELDLETYEGQYITAQETVMLNATVLPQDSTDRNIIWSCEDSNIGIVLNNSLFVFNSSGVARLVAQNGNINKVIEIRYTASKPISATVVAKKDNIEQDIPDKINVGEKFEILIKSLIPSNSSDRQILIKSTNHNTLNAGGKVVSIEDNVVCGVAGGNVTILIYVSSTITIIKEIEVIQDVLSISTELANLTTSEDKINLIATVFPIDATNKQVVFSMIEGNAYIENSCLYFLSNGKVSIRASSVSNPEIFVDFIVEKIEKDAIIISQSEDEIVTYIGEIFYVDYSIFTNKEFTNGKIEVISQSANNVLYADGNNIKILSIGNATVKISIFDNNNEIYSKSIKFKVYSKVESITLANDLDYYNGEYITALSKISLNFDCLPKEANNKEVSIVLNSNSAYIIGNELYFLKESSVTIEVFSIDGGAKEKFTIRYTDGKPLQVVLNYEDEIVLNEGEIVNILVSKIIPKDANITGLIMEVSGENNIVKILGNQITALKGGETTLSVEVSDDIIKIIKIKVIKKVTDIIIDDDILTSKNVFEINAQILPYGATYPNLIYSIEKNDIAYLSENVVYFNKEGSVIVTLETTDGSNISKVITITSSFGKLSEIVLTNNELSIIKNNKEFIYVNKVYPSDISSYTLEYEIISQNAIDGSNERVIMLENNLVTAMYGGNAIVRVWGIVNNQKTCYVDCIVNVVTHVESFSIEFDHELQTYQNSFITGQEVLNFSLKLNPVDVTEKDYTYTISDEKIAYIQDNQIVFLKPGTVVITFTSADKSNGVKKVSYNFNYTGTSLIDAQVDKTDFENNVMILEKGTSFKFKFSYLLPQDNNNLVISTENVQEQRVDISKSVIDLNGGVFYANAGGSYTFNLKVNNLNLGQFTFIVKSYANEIILEGDFVEINGVKTIYTSYLSYSINAYAYPSDTFQTELVYSSSNENIAQVNSYGLVTFSKYGLVTITISVKDNKNIFQKLNIEFTNELRSISFGEISNTTFNVGDNVDFVIIPNPSTATDFDYDILLSDNNIATHILLSTGIDRIIGNYAGSVTVTAKVKNSNIQTSIILTFVPKISSIELELDSVNDIVGLGGYRYFGNSFLKYNESTQQYDIVNTYQMKVNIKPSNDLANLLVWSSSNENIATVDQNGIVTFVGSSGKVTITVKAKSIMEGQLVASDSYTFNLVQGINIFGTDDENSIVFYNQEFSFAVNYLLSLQDTSQIFGIVLHDDILFDPNISNQVTYNIYGNGHSIYFYDVTNSKKLIIERNGIVLDNVTLRGSNFDSNGKLSDLRNKGDIVSIIKCNEVLLYNCIFENANNLVKTESSQVNIMGCVFRNCYSSGIFISRQENSEKVSEVYVKDSIFANSLLCGILFDIDKSSKLAGYENKLTLDGDIRFYNWITLDELEQGGINDVENTLAQFGLGGIAKDIIKQFREIMKKYDDYKYTYNGQDYYNFSIIQYDAEILGNHFLSNGIIYKGENFNSSNVYSSVKINGSLTLGGGLANADFILDVWMMPGQNAFIKPGQSHEEAFNKIRQPQRI